MARLRIISLAVVLIAAAVIAAEPASAPKEGRLTGGKRGGRRASRGKRSRRRGIKVGQKAPDFNLPLLKEEKDKKGNTVNRITREKIRLSSFR